jgi:hypothetical protein
MEWGCPEKSAKPLSGNGDPVSKAAPYQARPPEPAIGIRKCRPKNNSQKFVQFVSSFLF